MFKDRLKSLADFLETNADKYTPLFYINKDSTKGDAAGLTTILFDEFKVKKVKQDVAGFWYTVEFNNKVGVDAFIEFYGVTKQQAETILFKSVNVTEAVSNIRRIST